ncbi:odorant receptor 67d-like [Calliphora vicina]|uniref:odorant receptor 67d-like n=1 Tax=Calliphora vicina TaxID=7373 RepID=UPI00325C2050
MSRKHSNNFKKLFNFTRKFSELCGCDVIKDDYKLDWRTYAIFILINLALSCTVYSNYIEVIVKGDLYNLLKSASVIGTGVQGYTKLINGLRQQKEIRYLYREIIDMYETYELKSLAYKQSLKYNISLVKKLLAITFATVLIVSIGVTVVPLYMLIFQNIRVDIMPFIFPFIDTSTDFGFYLTFVLHIICVFFGTYGNFIMDSWLFIYAAHVPLMKNILKCKFDDLDGILEEYPRNVEKSGQLLSDIFKWHQKYINFCKTIKDTFFWVIAVQIGFEFMGIVCTIVCIFLEIWPPAPAYLLYISCLLYSYCSLGNIVEVSNDDVIDIIYDCCWYNLTVPEQKMILIMLRESQQATGILIGGVVPLSLNTALQITKTVYTMSMFLKSSLN